MPGGLARRGLRCTYFGLCTVARCMLTTILRGSLSARRAVAVLLGFVLATMAACGGDSGPEAEVTPPGPIDAGPGETVKGEGVSITLFEVGAAHSFDRREQAPEGKVFIAARFTITTTGTAVPAQGPDDLVLELPDGSVGKPWLVTPGSRLRNTGPPPGQELAGWRSWVVPAGTRAATLSYRPAPDLEIRFGISLSAEVRDRWNVVGDLRHV